MPIFLSGLRTSGKHPKLAELYGKIDFRVNKKVTGAG
jgi:hypothetical protein